MRPTMWSLLFYLCWISLAAFSQDRSSSPAARHPDYSVAPITEDEATARLARDMAKRANQERAVAVKTDTERLLKLAVELKAFVDKSNENVLSVDVIRKAEEIEKLAHSVRDKMKGPN
ncbi:MAG TPA: hypothetical protein VI386_21365 [Candidatus Sulfotelmatobacter sp.]